MRYFVGYLAVFTFLTLLDYGTTELGIHLERGRELNEIVVDSKGHLSARFLVINAVLGFICAAVFASGAGRFESENHKSPTWREYFGQLIVGSPYGLICAGVAILITKSLVPISNIGAISVGASLPGIISSLVADESVLMWSTLAAGIAIGVFLAKPLTPYVLAYINLIRRT